MSSKKKRRDFSARSANEFKIHTFWIIVVEEPDSIFSALGYPATNEQL